MKDVKAKKLKKIKRVGGLSEAAFNGIFPSVAHFAHPLITGGGVFALLLIPIVDIAKAIAYWIKSGRDDFDGSADKKAANRAFYTAKAILNSIGASLVITGIMSVPGLELIGFGMLITGLYATAARSFIKMLFSSKREDQKNIAKNGEKFLMTSLFAVGLNLIIFAPELGIVGLAMMVVASTHILFSALRLSVDHSGAHEDYMKVNMTDISPDLSSHEQRLGLSASAANLDLHDTSMHHLYHPAGTLGLSKRPVTHGKGHTNLPPSHVHNAAK